MVANNHMTYEELRSVWLEKQREHGLEDWTLELSRGFKVYGQCIHAPRRIKISKHYLAEASREQVIGTLLHEIAHALCGPGAGHGPRWRAKARAIGAVPRRCSTVRLKSAKGRAVARISCPNGCWEPELRLRRTKNRNYRCSKCKAQCDYEVVQ